MDGFSKFAWCYAHTDKRPQNILESLKQIFENNKYQYLWTDKGREFTAKVIQDYLKDHNIKWYSTQSELKCTLIERFNLTIREKLEKRKTLLELQGIHYSWINELPDIVDEYNNTVHSTIKMTPTDAMKFRE